MEPRDHLHHQQRAGHKRSHAQPQAQPDRRMASPPPPTPTPALGVCQWFHFEDYAGVERATDAMRDLGVTHIRTGISWADYLRPGGKRWYDWQMRALAEFDVLLSVWHTPPSLAEAPCCNAPPRRLGDYADFIDQVITEYGVYFTDLELWNEPNNWRKWDFRRFDPEWARFGAMISAAAYWARTRGRRTVLGGMIPVDPDWLGLMASYGAMEHIDVVGIHGFPEMWWDDAPNWDWYSHWNGWRSKARSIKMQCGERPIWITETGLATWDLNRSRPAREELQVRMLERAVAAAPDIERVYWYSLIDLDPARDAIEGFHVDENEYHMGLLTFDGARKPAYERFRELITIEAANRLIDQPTR